MTPDTPAIPQDPAVGQLFRRLAESSGLTLPAWCKASLIADVSSMDVKLVFEVPCTIGAIRECLREVEVGG